MFRGVSLDEAMWSESRSYPAGKGSMKPTLGVIGNVALATILLTSCTERRKVLHSAADPSGKWTAVAYEGKEIPSGFQKFP